MALERQFFPYKLKRIKWLLKIAWWQLPFALPLSFNNLFCWPDDSSQSLHKKFFNFGSGPEKILSFVQVEKGLGVRNVNRRCVDANCT